MINLEKTLLGKSYMAAQELAASGNYADAIKLYSQAMDGDSVHVMARMGRGMAFQHTGDHTRAIADFDETIACYPEWPGGFVAYYGRAVSRHALGQHSEVVKDCDEAICRNPRLADAFYLRGTAQKALGRLDAAIDDMNAVIKLDPCYAEAYLERGKLRYFQHRWQQAYEDCASAMRHTRSGSLYLRECFYLRGMALQELGEHRAAIADFTCAIDIVSNDGPAHLRRGWSYHELGEYASGDADIQVGTRLVQSQ